MIHLMSSRLLVVELDHWMVLQWKGRMMVQQRVLKEQLSELMMERQNTHIHNNNYYIDWYYTIYSYYYCSNKHNHSQMQGTQMPSSHMKRNNRLPIDKYHSSLVGQNSRSKPGCYVIRSSCWCTDQ